jgi:hypothetical protein
MKHETKKPAAARRLAAGFPFAEGPATTEALPGLSVI